MKKLLLAALLCGGFQAALADGSDYLDHRQQIFMQNLPEYNKEFNEMDVPLPAVPNPNEGDWFELYIDNLYKGSPRKRPTAACAMCSITAPKLVTTTLPPRGCCALRERSCWIRKAPS